MLREGRYGAAALTGLLTAAGAVGGYQSAKALRGEVGALARRAGDVAEDVAGGVRHRGQLGESAPLQSSGGRLLPPEPRTPGLGDTTSIDELLSSGALPSDVRVPGGGVTLTDKTVKFGDLYKLSTQDGRRIEFALTSEVIAGRRTFRLYSGAENVVVTPKGARVIGHTHPTPHINQRFPSPGDLRKFNNDYFNELLINPVSRPKPSRIIWGEGLDDNTVFYPGFHKSY